MGFAREVANRARAAVQRVSPRELLLSASAGFACHPAHTNGETSIEELAASALSLAKRAGGDETRKYNAEQAANLPSLREQRAEILALLSRPSPITPAFQPIVELSTGRIAGYEALSRFEGSERGPDAWFGQAGRCGLGPRLEAEAIRAALEFPNRPPGTYLSLNFSPSALASRRVMTVLPRDLSDVVIEITEHELASEDGSLEASLNMMRGRGARIAVDDAGAGYAGLQQVMRVQPDIIKLDRGLIEKVDIDPAKAALVEFFVLFAARTGASVCTEGIETVGELAALVELNVNFGQGFVLGRPAMQWTGIPPQLAKALAVGSLRRHQRPARPAHVLGPVNRRLQRFQQQAAAERAWQRPA
jgi:EAL domain-containing protein (putative c-di-GMP-specific phosphodiesterase class I)